MKKQSIRTFLLSVLAASVLSLSAHAQNTYPPNVLWHNFATGELSMWRTGFDGAVTGMQSLTWPCGAATGCSETWSVVGQISGNPLWHNRETGQLSVWHTDDESGIVSEDQILSWRCDRPSGCSTTWKVIGTEPGFLTDFSVFWVNQITGEISRWDVNGVNGEVRGAKGFPGGCTLVMYCGDTVGLGRFTYDGFKDALIYFPISGELQVRSLATGDKIQTIDWHCDIDSGCAQTFKIVGVGDFNGDGFTDVLWFNRTSGELSAWLLDGAGKVSRAQSLKVRCDAASGCSQAWRPVTILEHNSVVAIR
jgi:hypothetical protein